MIAFCITASANTVSKAEKSKVENAVRHFNEYLYDSNVYGEKPNVKTSKNDSNLTNVYKSYIINGYIIDDYKKLKSFGSLISNETRIFAESGSQLITLIDKDNNIEAIGSMLLNEGEKLVNYEDEAQKIRSQSKEKILDMKFVKSYDLNADMIYFKTSGGEFVVPYFDNAPKSVSSTISNGKIYSASEFVDRLSCVIDLSTIKSNDISYGGIPYRDVALAYPGDNIISQNSGVFIIVLVSGLVLMSLLFVFITKKYSRK